MNGNTKKNTDLHQQIMYSLKGQTHGESYGLVTNPRFVEALMGFRRDWTLAGCQPLETPSSPSKHPLHGKS
jgi:hypothetical protein